MSAWLHIFALKVGHSSNFLFQGLAEKSFLGIYIHSIQVVDTPGIFDTKVPKDVVHWDNLAWFSLLSLSLVLELSCFTQEEEENINYFVNYFGEGVFRCFIVLFTRNDDLDHHGKTLDDHIKTAPQYLKTIIAKCGYRCIAFNNKASSPAKLK